MDEKDKQRVDNARVAFELDPPSMSKAAGQDLLTIIDRLSGEEQRWKTYWDNLLDEHKSLKVQLARMREAGEPFVKWWRDSVDNEIVYNDRVFRRLAEAMEEGDDV
jgi:hypothetical protein